MGVVQGVEGARPAHSDVRTAIEPGALAWLLAVPVALVAIALVALLGPPLGQLLHSGANPYDVWSELRWAVVAEPTEQGRFLLAIAAPLLLAAALAAAARRPIALPPRLAAVAVPLAQVVLLAAIVVCVAVQQRLVYEVPIYQPTVSHRWRYFTPATLLAAAALTAGAYAVLARPGLRARAAAALRETDRRRLVAMLLAVVLTAVWLLHAVNTDSSIMGTSSHEWSPAQFTLDETYAVLDGRTPLVDFTAQYGSLWPYLTAAALALFGQTFLVFSLAMCAITAVSLLAVYALLRRIAGNGVTALLLYLPFLATSLFIVGGTTTSRYTFGDYFGVFPLRYAGPFLLAWLIVRQLDGAGGGRVRHPWVLGAVAGLCVLNNAEFGLAALAATVAALVWTAPDRRPRPLARLAGRLALGLLAAYALLAVLALVRTGGLPQLGRLLDYGRLYSVGGFGLLHLHRLLGLHLVLYLTYAAAIAVATVRALEHAPNRPLTGMLAWSGVFGLGSAAYFMGRTHPELLVALFPTWALALALLSVDALGRLRGRPGLGTLLVLLGMAVTACSLAQLPAPWTQLDRISQEAPSTPLIEGESPLPRFDGAFLPDRSTRGFFAPAHPGEPVAILLTTGHQIAHAFGVEDVSRYTGMYSIVTRERLRTVVDDLRAAGGGTLFLPDTYQQVYDTLARWGFERRSAEIEWGGVLVSKWVDTTSRGNAPG